MLIFVAYDCIYCRRYTIAKENNENWIGIEEIAEHLGVKPRTIRDWIKNGKGIPAYKIGRFWKFNQSEVDEWVRSGNAANED